MDDITMTDALLARVDDLTPAELDELPMGMIQLDTSGRIVKYNASEARLAGVSQAKQVGRHFFTEVAPCTQVREFQGRFAEGVAAGALDATFTFHFPFAERPRDVVIRLFHSARTGTVWVFVLPRAGTLD